MSNVSMSNVQFKSLEISNCELGILLMASGFFDNGNKY
jgi:hypothetical protein